MQLNYWGSIQQFKVSLKFVKCDQSNSGMLLSKTPLRVCPTSCTFCILHSGWSEQELFLSLVLNPSVILYYAFSGSFPISGYFFLYWCSLVLSWTFKGCPPQISQAPSLWRIHLWYCCHLILSGLPTSSLHLKEFDGLYLQLRLLQRQKATAIIGNHLICFYLSGNIFLCCDVQYPLL